MSATVAAALKKIAVAILTDKKLRKAVLGIVLGIIIIVIMPVVAVIALFNGDINIDTDRLQQIVVEEMSDEEKAKLQAVLMMLSDLFRREDSALRTALNSLQMMNFLK